ncbi:MAG: NADH:ubiquinone oxidoreductase, partial [Elusimicrobia bacterium]|nr:NADH:ubiquinone oxidoreductase [Elusimicrobiota bacterium]
SNEVAAIRGTISDAAITLAAVDPCYCCTERCAVIDTKTNKRILTGDDLIKISQEKTDSIRRSAEKTKGY